MINSLLALPFALAALSTPDAAPGLASQRTSAGDALADERSVFLPASLRDGAGSRALAMNWRSFEQSVGATVVPVQPRSAALVDLSVTTTGAIAVPRAADGLFYVHGTVNGVVVRFLVDTGATSIVLTADDAARAGLAVRSDDYRYNASTVGGKTAMARVRVTRLATGATERRDVEAAVVNSGLTVSLLGQSWLAQLRSLSISGNTLRLE